MIITIFGIIVFQLICRNALELSKSSIEVVRLDIDMLRLSYNIVPTRHEVRMEP
jgi:hypothetical protein